MGRVSDAGRLTHAPTRRPLTPLHPPLLQVNDVDLVERVGTHVVAKIKGDLQETFDRLDEDGDGQISASELAALLADVNQGQAVDEQSVQRVMSEVAKRRDAEGNGIILFDDFRKWYGTRPGHSSGRRTAHASSSLTRYTLPLQAPTSSRTSPATPPSTSCSVSSPPRAAPRRAAR